MCCFYGAIIVDMNKTFPFGLPILPVGQVPVGLPKKLFILGVYASAVHVKWYGPDGRLRIHAMAVASEPSGEAGTTMYRRLLRG